MRSINMTFSDEDFQKLKAKKMRSREKMKVLVLSWEDFVFQTICGK